MGEVERFLEAQGLNARALLDGARQAGATAGDALETARPTVDSTVSTVSSTLLSTDPVVLAEYAAGLVALYYLARPPWGGVQFGFLGFVNPVVLAEYAAGLVVLDYLVRPPCGDGQFRWEPCIRLYKHLGFCARVVSVLQFFICSRLCLSHLC